jgi:hypothetical protein
MFFALLLAAAIDTVAQATPGAHQVPEPDHHSSAPLAIVVAVALVIIMAILIRRHCRTTA